ncbi:4-diphosphocytidyl-2-C-methyl-D-erythritol kinase [Neoasaia chiangmaiensis NBRC 101099]|uniref:4-diphosphocytidyl-2-C-methyl-D-erythritol kinase n=1 Tax=Neoasaia chiangmaiensis TaxID=320497 RepID=A0A1U9KM17_9PROT|nr:4-(cytidine 5'-diphospho)-2-C-methyl-D-erythritol kinase [Neoasaia chiangmaiensis]AQS86833.1 hypothetical protein A0U93_01445 [Neoasaia chiangmaiensis]GBR37336.1 4-diphosphocytidyl-2-C-methyl-D-erythritol kinase [Neoasaia chiangmaiensis NBRC 101099]GEN14902.1 4-diphosphocytidyl-2-C-methyl-D-erythritol kinase [Neoasaia chiangmaiensis]
MNTLETFAHAKINLFLHVTARRPNGYHELDSLAVFAAAADRLRLVPAMAESDGARLSISGPFGAGLEDGPGNLVSRAIDLLRNDAGARGSRVFGIELDKRLPVASGIGGGSADAAAALRLAATAWDMAHVDLTPYAEKLGADVPVCLAQRPARMQGIGEVLTPGPIMPRLSMVLANPGIAVPTPEVFGLWKQSGAAFRDITTLPAEWHDLTSVVDTLRHTTNDLQSVAIARYPMIGTVIEALGAQPGCALARMSGSGATCFGLFATRDAAETAAFHLAREGWWTHAGPLYDPGCDPS